ncbi:hypothetical protein PINS_up014238 [Pythium insidiosum]|nr:hypothetical protein PINS_up014238 [Pythium insidiosum]
MLRSEATLLQLAATDTAAIDDDERERLTRQIGVFVPQSPTELLVSCSRLQSSPSTSTSKATSSTDVTVWWSDTGDLFYSDALRGPVGTRQRYDGDAETGDQATVQTRLLRWRRELHSFLWDVMEAQGWGITRLFESFVARHKSVSWRCMSLALRDDHACPWWHALRQEEWYALLASIPAAIAIGEEAKDVVSLHAFKVFLVDPSHLSFWRQYVARWNDYAVKERHRSRVLRFLERNLRNDNRDRQDPAAAGEWVPWNRVVRALRELHRQAGEPALSATDICRLLYRFDRRGDGRIVVQDVLGAFGRVLQLQCRPQSTAERTPHVAVSSRRPPDVDAFMTSDALRRLYASRSHRPDQPERQAPPHATEASALRRVANSRLAQIRQLPVTQLLR